MIEAWDSIIVGGGPAGLTAAIYLSRLGFKTLLLEAEKTGGRLRKVDFIENYPGFPEGISGSELADRFARQAVRFGAEIREYEEVTMLQTDTTPRMVATRKGNVYSGYTIILALGAPRRTSEIRGEEKLLGRGVSYCAVCDGPLYHGREVAVVGSGREAVEDALLLSKIAGKVYLLSPSLKLHEKLEDKPPNLEVYYGVKPREIVGSEKVESIRFTSAGREVEIPVSGVFIALGVLPATKLLRNTPIELTAEGFVKVDRYQATGVEGVYAAGDCVGVGFQVAVSVGQAATAALSASTYLRKIARKT